MQSPLERLSILKEFIERGKKGMDIILLRLAYKSLLEFYYSVLDFDRPEGFSIVNKDWDVLMILDCARYDTFKLYSPFRGKLKPMISKGSWTPEWLEKNFPKEYYKDIIYVSGNTFSKKIIDGDEKFYKHVEVYSSHWDEELDTVPPDPISAYTLKLNQEYPDKKIVAHYMQPHFPSIGKTKVKGWWEEFYTSNISLRRMYKAYLENFQKVVRSIRNLLPWLKGEVVLSSDHGTLFGELGMYGHPKYIYHKNLITVPWFKVDMNYYNQKKPKKRPFQDIDLEREVKSSEKEIKEKLKKLGYLQI